MRLKDLRENNYSAGRQLISTFSSPEDFDQERFLKKRALDMEIKGMSNTYLLVNPQTDTAIGYFTVNAGIKCAYDKPIYEISHLCAGVGCPPRYTGNLLKLIVQMFMKCTERLGPLNITARCRDEELDLYEDAGFTYIGKTLGRFNRVVLYT